MSLQDELLPESLHAECLAQFRRQRWRRGRQCFWGSLTLCWTTCPSHHSHAAMRALISEFVIPVDQHTLRQLRSPAEAQLDPPCSLLLSPLSSCGASDRPTARTFRPVVASNVPWDNVPSNLTTCVQSSGIGVLAELPDDFRELLTGSLIERLDLTLTPIDGSMPVDRLSSLAHLAPYRTLYSCAHKCGERSDSARASQLIKSPVPLCGSDQLG